MGAGLLPRHMILAPDRPLRGINTSACGCVHTPDTQTHTHCMLQWPCDYSAVTGVHVVM